MNQSMSKIECNYEGYSYNTTHEVVSTVNRTHVCAMLRAVQEAPVQCTDCIPVGLIPHDTTWLYSSTRHLSDSDEARPPCVSEGQPGRDADDARQAKYERRCGPSALARVKKAMHEDGGLTQKSGSVGLRKARRRSTM